MDPTVMFAAYTQTRMDGGGGGAAKQEYERKLQVNNQKIRELTRGGAGGLKEIDFRLDARHEQRRTAKEHTEKPALSWTDDCECRQQVSAVTVYHQGQGRQEIEIRSQGRQ
jgi:hypothetical protein